MAKKPLPSKLDEHALALGHVCIAWNQLELQLDLLIMNLIFAKSPGNPVTADQSKYGQIIAANIDMRAKIQIALAIGFARRPDDQWFDKLQTCLHELDNDLRLRRNRAIHDLRALKIYSTQEMDEIITKTTKTKIIKPQSYVKELQISKTTTEKLEEIWKLRDDIRDSGTMIVVLTGNFLHPGFFPWP